MEAPWLGDVIREEGSGIVLCFGLRNIKAAGSVWSLPAPPPGCHWGEGVDAGLHVQPLEPDRTAFQFSRPWRKQITDNRKQLLLMWQPEMQPMEQRGNHEHINGKSSLIKHWEQWNVVCFPIFTPAPIVSLLPAAFIFICPGT